MGELTRQHLGNCPRVVGDAHEEKKKIEFLGRTYVHTKENQLSKGSS